MKKGVILEIKSQYLIMLTPNGEFIKGKKSKGNYSVGEEIFFYPYENLKPNRKRHLLWSLPSAATVIVIISFFLFSPFEKDLTYAYVTMDMNPSIEFVLDKNFNVINTNAYNKTGEQLLASVKIEKKQSFVSAAKAVLTASNNMGYLGNKQHIVMASIPKSNDSKRNNELTKEVLKVRIAANNIKAKVEVLNGSIKERMTAQKKGISTGRFIVEKKKEKESKPNALMQAPKLQEKIPMNKQSKSNHNFINNKTMHFEQRSSSNPNEKNKIKVNSKKIKEIYIKKHKEKTLEKKKNHVHQKTKKMKVKKQEHLQRQIHKKSNHHSHNWKNSHKEKKINQYKKGNHQNHNKHKQNNHHNQNQHKQNHKHRKQLHNQK
ncbi:hypothetical protein J6TS2_03150 [Heyndrickxia sporothermodurans]|nr:hypothetical protein J6TS2_03150 [Heyndrickxia sporothermodurans]